MPFRDVLNRTDRGLTGRFLLHRNFGVAFSIRPHECVILVLILMSTFMTLCIFQIGIFHASRTTKCLMKKEEPRARVFDSKPVYPYSNFTAGGPKAALLFWLVLVVSCGLCCFVCCWYIVCDVKAEPNIKNRKLIKYMFSVYHITNLSWFYWWVSFAPEFQCYYFCESSCLFYRCFNSDFYVSKIMHL